MSEPEQSKQRHPPEDPSPGQDQVGKNVQWTAGVVGGLAGGVAMGLIMQFAMGVMELVGAIVGVQSALAGWGVHLAVSVLYGLIFAWTVSWPFVRDEFVNSLGGSVLVGIVYGGLLTVVSGGVVLQMVTAAVGAEQPFSLIPLPGTIESIWLAVWGGVAHLVYGLILGAAYAAWRGPGIGFPSATEH